MRNWLLICFGLIHFLSDAQTLDPGFDVKAGIKSSKNGGVRVIKLYSEGYMLAGHFDNFQGTPITSLAKVDAVGNLDTKFSVSFEPAIVNDIAILPDRTIIAVGEFEKVNGSEHRGIVKINPDGSVDDKFNAIGLTGKGVLRTVEVDDKGEAIYVGGEFDEFNSEGWNNIVKLSPGGDTDQGFNPRGTKEGTGVYDLHYYAGAGRLLIAGEFNIYDDQQYLDLVRVFEDGSVDDSFKSVVIKGRVYAVDVSSKDQTVIAAGKFTDINGKEAFSLAAFDVNGNHITEFSPRSFEGTEIYNVEVPDNGPIIIVGEFSSITGLGRNNIALINPSNGEAVAAIGPGSGTDQPSYAISPSVNSGYVIGGDYAYYNCEFSYGATQIVMEDAGESAIVMGSLDLGVLCSGASFNVLFNATGSFCNNSFQVQLSDASGDFSNPTILGSLAADVDRGKGYSGSIKATIPGSVPSGTGYQVRVAGTSPAAISNATTKGIRISQGLGATGNISGPTAVCSGNTASYSIAAVSGATSYSWTVPSGSNIISGNGSRSITVQFGTASGAVRVVPVGDCGTGSARSVSVTVSASPASSLGNVFGPTTLCVGLVESYVIDGNGTYQWTVPSGVTILSGNGTSGISVRASSGASDGLVSVVEVNGCGSSQPSELPITIFEIQDPGPIVVSNNNPCPDEIVTLSVNDVGATSANWQQFDGITPLNDSSTTIFTFRTNGNSGQIGYSYTFSQCSASGTAAPVAITTKQFPGSMGALSIPATICENEKDVAISVPAVTNATDYQWTLPSDAVIASGDNTESITVDFGTTNGLVSVVAINECGLGGSQEASVNLAKIPVSLGAISGPNNVCENSGASYSVAGSRIGTYVWSLPVGATFGSDPNSASVEVNFASNGGQVTVAAQNQCGTGPTSTLPVTVDRLPTPSQIVGQSTPCANSTGLQYTVPAVADARSYTWQVSKGLELVGQSSNRAIVNVGTSTGVIRVVVADNCGTGSSTLNITPDPLPGNAGTISGNTKMCPGTSGQTYFIDPVADADSYEWTLPAGAKIVSGAGTSSIVVDFTTTDGLITVTPKNACGDGGSSEISMVFDPLPQGAPKINGETTPCSGATYTYQIEPVNFATSYSWSIPPGAKILSGGGTSVNVQMGTQSGTVSVTPSNSCGVGTSDALAVTVDTPPAIGAIVGPSTVCEGESATYTVNNVSDAISYFWSGPKDATVVNGSNSASVTFGQESGTIGIVVTDACGSVSASVPVTVNSLPGGAGAITGPSSVCESQSGVTYSILPVANATSYTWSGPSGATITGNGSNSVTVDFGSVDGNISVTPTNACGNGNSNVKTVRFNILATPGPIAGNMITCPNAKETYSINSIKGASNYTWIVPPGATVLSGQGTISAVVQIGTQSGGISVTPSGACGNGESTSEFVTVNGVTPSAGEDQNICDNTTNLAAELQTGESGIWRVVQGAGDFVDDTDPFTVVNNIAEGINIYRWTVDNGDCSGSATVQVNATYPVTPTVSILAGSNPICSGELTSFSSRANNVGTGPTYVWRKNGIPVGANSPGYSDATLVNNDQITLEVTTSETCVTASVANSNTITMSVNASVTPVVAIKANKNPICNGESVTWSVIDSTGGGATPSFQWFKNGLPVGNDDFQYVDSNPTNGDEYTVEMTSSSSCAAVSTANSSIETIIVQSPPTVTNGQTYEVCTGDGIVALNGIFNGASGVIWTSNGDGSFSNATSATPTYTLGTGDLGSSTLTLTMTTTGNGACPAAVANNIVTVIPSPSVSVGRDLEMCANDGAINLATDVQLADSYSWATSGSGSFSPTNNDIATPTYTPSIADINSGVITLSVTANKSGCTSVTKSIDLTINPNPIADAGVDQNVCVGSALLLASPLSGGETGMWQLFSGNALFNDATSNGTKVSSLQLGNNILLWVVDNGNCSDVDTVVINRGRVTKSQVISDKTVCLDTVYIAANQPSGIESGVWTVFSGQGTFADASGTSTYVSNLGLNANNVFVWTITRGVCSSSDTLTVTQITTTKANAGQDIEVCTDAATVNGNAITAQETASWSIYSGGGLISTPNTRSTGIQFLDEGDNELIYAISRGICTTYDTVIVTNNEVSLSTIQSSNICGNQDVLSAPTLKAGETGLWTVISGQGTIDDETDPNADVTNMAEGVNTYQWEVTKGSCSDAVTETITTEYITTPTVTISVGTNPICNGENVSFSSTLTQGGASPVYQWKLNGIDVGNNTSRFFSDALANGDQVSLEVVSSKNCVTTNMVTSNTISMMVSTNVIPQTAITVSNDSICEGDDVVFTVVDSTGGGNNPSFEWFRNGTVLFGVDENTLTLSDLVDKDEVFVRMTSSSTCALKPYDSSSVASINVFSIPTATLTDVVVCTDTSTLIAPDLEPGQTGVWSVISGSGTIAMPTMNQSFVDNLGVGQNTFLWTLGYSGVDNCEGTATVAYDYDYVQASAGANQTIRDDATTLGASDPQPATGVWTTSGTSTIQAPTNPATAVTGLEEGENEFIWTVTSGLGCMYKDTVLVNYLPNLPFVDAGPDQSICVDNTALAANTPLAGETGTWSVLQGSVIFTDNTDEATTVTNVAPGKNILVWTINNGLLASDSVVISYQVPIIAVQDLYTVPAGDSVLIDVTTNDVVAGGDILTVSIIQPPKFGNVTISVDGTTLKFDSQDPTILGNDTVIYQVMNQCGAFDQGRVVVQTLNTGPVLPPRTIVTQQGKGKRVEYEIALLDVNQNINLDSLTITYYPSRLKEPPAIFAENGFLYISLDLSKSPNYTTEEDSIKYRVCDTYDVCAESKVVLKVGATSVETPSGLPGIIAYQGISPNGDGNNDTWVISLDIQDESNEDLTVYYPNALVKIVNRWGDVIFSQKGDITTISWDGTKNGSELPDGTYYYLIDSDDNGKVDEEGFIVLKK